MGKKRKKRGPKAEYLQIDGDWKDAVKKVFGKKKPADEGSCEAWFGENSEGRRQEGGELVSPSAMLFYVPQANPGVKRI